MHTLIITAHPSSQGFTHKIAAAYEKGSRSGGATVEILDLYKTPYKQDFYAFENIREPQTGNEHRKTLQDMIQKADRLVFVHPLWWGGMPAILKNFIDHNITGGFAFKYGPRKFVPEALNVLPKGLLKGKRASVFITCDAYVLLYATMLLPFLSIWYFFILFYCGMWRVSFRVYGRMRWKKSEKRDAILKNVEALAKKQVFTP